jgi:hypothetical protein
LLTILDVALNVILALFVVLIDFDFVIVIETVLMMMLMTTTTTTAMSIPTVSSTKEMTLEEKILVTLMVKKIHSFVFLSVVV